MAAQPDVRTPGEFRRAVDELVAWAEAQDGDQLALIPAAKRAQRPRRPRSRRRVVEHPR